MPIIPLQMQLLLLMVVLTASVYDLRYRKIPNWLCLGGMLLGFGGNLVLLGLPGLRSSGFGFMLGFGIYMGLYVLRAMGAGDVKLMGAVGALAGASAWFALFLFTAVTGGVIALVLVFSKGKARQTLYNVAYILGELSRLRAPHSSRADLDVKNPTATRLPHAVTIAVGTITYLAVAWYRAY